MTTRLARVPLPLKLLKDIWNDAEIIKSYSTVTGVEKNQVCVTDDNCAYTVKRDGKLFSCQCSRFIKLGLCSHIVMVADMKDCLRVTLNSFTYCPSKAIQRHKPTSAGEKHVKNQEKESKT